MLGILSLFSFVTVNVAKSGRLLTSVIRLLFAFQCTTAKGFAAFQRFSCGFLEFCREQFHRSNFIYCNNTICHSVWYGLSTYTV